MNLPMTAIKQPIILKNLGCVDFLETEYAMKQFTKKRSMEMADEVWLLEHNPVYSTGIRQVSHPVLKDTKIPVVKTNRGGEMTYHGPGQLIAYFLLNIRKRRLGPKSLVYKLEEMIIEFLASYKVSANRKEGAPGVYVDGSKIASLGLHTTTTYCYHGISININMDLRPFKHIEVCGIPNLEMTQLSELVGQVSIKDAMNKLENYILKFFSV